MKSLVIYLSLACFSLTATGQQYLVRYDVVAEELKYFRIKKKDTIPVNMIFLDGSNRVNLQVLNIGSNFSQHLVMHEKADVPETIVIPGFGGQGGQGVESMFKSGSNLNVEDFLKNLQTENKANATALKMEMTAFTTQYNRFNEHYSKWLNAVKQSDRFRQLWKDLAVLRYTVQYDASTVKSTAIQKTKPILPALVNDPNSPAVDASSSDPQAFLRQMTTSLAIVKERYDKMAELDYRSDELDSLVEQLSQQWFAVDRYSKTNPVGIDDLIARITELYKGIMFDRYSQLSNLPVTRKTLMAELQLIPKIDSVTATAIQLPGNDTIVRWLPIIKKEPLRFRNTFGFGFVSLPENRWRYYVREDSTVGRSSGDLFQPVIATYLHFYSMKDKGFRWGGSFGAGIPLSGEDKQLNLMLGLSTFFGKNDPVCLTIGVAGARVKKLMEHSVGDLVFGDDADLKYEQAYRIGYFLSLSFNPSALNSKD